VRYDSVGLRFEDVGHRYGSSVAVSSASLAIPAGELVALLGPSGCGKTTLLRIAAGLQRQTSGTVRFGDEVVDALPPNERGAGIVFQSYALFPHMTVEANVAYGLRARGTPKTQSLKMAHEMLEMVRMTAYGQRYPKELSGGQQQRVALARTLVVKPRVLLLDEPFAALDKNLRLDMQIEIRRIQQSLGITTILVTHDQEEAMSMADRIAVMNLGQIEQFDTPEAIYDRPLNRFVATFVGSATLITGRLTQNDAGTHAVECDGGGKWHVQHPSPCSRNGAVVVAARPEHLELTDVNAPGSLTCKVGMAMALGPSVIYDLVLLADDGRDNTSPASPSIKVTQPRTSGMARYVPGDLVGVSLRAGSPAAVFAA
jgi:putative spermidine/putrescine transport system ATP-binding protein